MAKPTFRQSGDIPICDRARLQASNPELRLGFDINAGSAEATFNFKRTDRDLQPPKSVVTAQLLGDPAAGRSALDKRNKT